MNRVTEAPEVSVSPQKKQPFQRFHRILGRGLSVGIETNALKSAVSSCPLGDDLKVAPGQNDVDYIRHSAIIEGSDLHQELLLNPESAKPVTITFAALPAEFPVCFQRINFRQRQDNDVIGIAYGRFPTDIAEEKVAFHGTRNDRTGECYLNLDCLSKAKEWQPLFVKYRLRVVPSLRKNEYGYLRIDVMRGESNAIIVTVSRIGESEAPPVLVAAHTLPR
ncbi:MAG: hypothetical protein KGI60_03840 [Patescibacteria group bacterium]|nr:hypothetical protein [Patescibacteria group bacterium]